MRKLATTRAVGVLGGVLLGLLARPAQAQLALSLTPITTLALPGDHLTFNAILTNIGIERIDLLGTAGTVTGPASDQLLWDDLDFLTFLPASLVGGEVYQRDLFVDVLTGALDGLYDLSYTVDGSGAVTQGAFSGVADVTVTVAAQPSTAAPEPASLALTLPVLGGIVWRRRRAVS